MKYRLKYVSVSNTGSSVEYSRLVADVTRNVLNAVHAVNVVLEVLLTSEHFSAMLTTIILLALFGLLSTMCFNFVSLKKLENFSTNVASEGKKKARW